MSPDQQKSKVNTQQKLGARTGPKVLQFLRLLSTRCLVLAGDACLSLSFSCFFFPAQVTGDMRGRMSVCSKRLLVHTKQEEEGRGYRPSTHTCTQ